MQALTRINDQQWDLHGPEPCLTKAEKDVLKWLVKGFTTKEIARQTFRSPHTIGNQTRSILKKLGARNRAHAVAIAIETLHLCVHAD